MNFKDLLDPADRARLERDQKWRNERVTETRSLSTRDLLVHTIHNVSFRASKSSVVNAQYAMQERWAARITDRLLAVSSVNSATYLARGIGRPRSWRLLGYRPRPLPP